MKLRIANWIYKNLSGDPKEECVVPGDWLRYEFGEINSDTNKPFYVARTSNDGFELWLAYNEPGHGWLAHYPSKAARQLAWFVLWHWWGKSTWFGLKRKLWYWALHERLMSQEWYRKRYGIKG